MYLPTKHLGLKFSLPSDIYACCQLSTRNILKTSQNLETQELCQLTKLKFIKEDATANKANKDKLSDRIAKKNIEKILGNINGLKEQKVILQEITQSCSCNALINKRKVCKDLPENIYVFIRKTLMFTLPNNTNLLRWEEVDSALCTLCKTNNKTQLHMLNNCTDQVNTHGVTIPFYM